MQSKRPLLIRFLLSVLRTVLLAVAIPLVIVIGIPFGFLTFVCLFTAGLSALHGGMAMYQMLLAAFGAAALSVLGWWPYQALKRKAAHS